MINSPIDPSNSQKWHRIYLNAFWSLLLLSVALELFGLIAVSDRPLSYAVYNLLYPTLAVAGIIGGLELLLPRLTRGSEHALIVGVSLIAAVFVFVHHTIDFIQALFLIPIFFSAFYIRKRLAVLAFVLNWTLFMTLTLLHPALGARTGLLEIVFMTGIMAGMLLLSFGLMDKTQEFVEHLHSMTKHQQELLVKNIIMDKQMKVDALTGLYNHITFHEYSDKLLEMKKHHDFPLWLAIVDIDNFKSINDTYGHRTGDLVLRSVAEAIHDTITPNDFAARYGGEEFAILLTDKSFSEALYMMEQVRMRISLLHHEELGGRTVTVSIGLYEHRHGDDKEKLFRTADSLLYEAKRTGKNRTCTARAS